MEADVRTDVAIERERTMSALKRGVAGLDIPLSINMIEEHLAHDTLVVFSHMGWGRCSLQHENQSVADNYLKLITFYERRIMEIMPNAADSNFAISQIPKLNYWNGGKYRLLMDEMALEEAFEHLSAAGVPIILTVPCDIRIDGEGFFFAPSSSAGIDTYTRYINIRANGFENVYLLPTQPNSGVILLDPNSGALNVIEFNKSPEGKMMLGNVLGKRWKEVLFLGGGLASCMANTMLYFYQQDNITTFSRYSFSTAQVASLELPKEKIERMQDLVMDTLIRTKERGARTELLDGLREHDTSSLADERWKVCDLFNFLREKKEVKIPRLLNLDSILR
jgi:hypothetical protein